MSILSKLLSLLTKKDQKQATLILFMTILMALMDAIGVASILPFMAVLTNPSLIETNHILDTLFKASHVVGVDSQQKFIFLLGFCVLFLLVFSLGLKAITNYFQIRFIQFREYLIGKRLLEVYLNQPYSWFLSKNSASLSKTILSEVNQVINIGLRPVIAIITNSLISISLIILLVLVNPKISIILGFSLSMIYFFIFYILKNFIKKIGEQRLKENELRFKTVNETFGAVKEIKVRGLEEKYTKLFSKSAERYAYTQASSEIISQLPRYILESISFGGALLIILFLMAKSGSLNEALPTISLYVFSGYRLIPAIQRIYASITQIAFVRPSIEKLHDDLLKIKPNQKNAEINKLSFNKHISLKNISYTYPDQSRTALSNISLSIPSNKIVGFIGSTGSGKSTLIDIILGLLSPQSGTVEIDGEVISKKNKSAWQSYIGYVPQNIYLSDDTIAGNIAFGVDENEIDYNALNKAAKLANIHDFINKELPNQYNTTVGERGIRLSGGQLQRIGIARALYNNPKVIIFDEATSALDYETEKVIMDAINNLNKKMTIIIIAHRLNTLSECDIIFKIDKGRLISQGAPI